ncbi:hypothetical protein Plo01_53400 [Planobispora longispora]|uniref:Uncharacterized protein n=1 Tax=Planobispora longispora TaxID=28887 RepID=A0A8J3RLS2_9ACTN|nr:hypothetical protein Plo01_53400 [Planobispora longispora]
MQGDPPAGGVLRQVVRVQQAGRGQHDGDERHGGGAENDPAHGGRFPAGGIGRGKNGGRHAEDLSGARPRALRLKRRSGAYDFQKEGTTIGGPAAPAVETPNPAAISANVSPLGRRTSTSRACRPGLKRRQGCRSSCSAAG